MSPFHLDKVDGSRFWAPFPVYFLREPWAFIPYWPKLSCQGGPSVAYTRTPLVSTHYTSSHHAKVTAAGHPETLPAHTALAPDDFLWHPLGGRPPPCTHLGSSHPARIPWLAPTSAAAVKDPSAWRAQGNPQLKLTSGSAVCQGTHYVEILRTMKCPGNASPCPPQLQPASQNYQAYTVYIGDDHT